MIHFVSTLIGGLMLLFANDMNSTPLKVIAYVLAAWFFFAAVFNAVQEARRHRG